MSRILMIKTKKEKFHYLEASSPPLGLMCLAAYARQFRKHDEYLIIDERLPEWGIIDWEKQLNEFDPHYIVTSSLTVEAQRLKELTEILKKIAPDVPIIAGGPHITAYGERILKETKADYLIQGEGEIAFLRLLNALDKGEKYPEENISGLVYRKADGTFFTVPANTELPDVPSLPFPAWDLIDLHAYATEGRMTPIHDRQTPYASLFTSRGCPYRCTYCHPIFKKGFRAMPAKRAVDEIEYLIKNYGVHYFEIYDDIFNADYQRVEDICTEIRQRHLETYFAFPNAIRGDRLDHNLLTRLRSVGTYHMAFAVESGSQRIQKLVHKNIKLDKIRESISCAAKLGIFSWGFFMMGFPTETREEILKTINFATNSDLHGAFFFVVVPFGGTKIAEEFSILQDTNAKTGDYHYSYNTLAKISAMELTMLQSYAYIKFFYSPRRVLHIINDYPFGFKSLLSSNGRLNSYIFERLVKDKPTDLKLFLKSKIFKST